MKAVTLYNKGMYLVNGIPAETAAIPAEEARRGTIAYSILDAHNVSGNMDKLQIKFDALVSHDITYVGIIQTARASGLKEFPIPYAMTNCHNSLCAVGGTINEDDHVFGLSAAKKYGGIYVPANQSVIHSYAREELAGCGKMILGSDSHTRYGALGTMGVGEGGPELVKQLLKNTYDVNRPEVVMVYLHGTPKKGIGPHDVALALVGATFADGFVKNAVTHTGVKLLSGQLVTLLGSLAHKLGQKVKALFFNRFDYKVGVDGKRSLEQMLKSPARHDALNCGFYIVQVVAILKQVKLCKIG